MGVGGFTASDWNSYASTHVSNKSVDDIFTAKAMNEGFDPKNVLRESRDSTDHPESTPIIIGLDVTGSMGCVLEQVAKELGNMVLEILERQPVKDPQIMFNAIGDSQCGDQYPLQVTQFESDIRIAKQLTDLYFERGGGGNDFESYPLTWYFAANHTVCDNFEKRGKKGFIFTMGDDSYPKVLYADEIKRIFGDQIKGAGELTMNEILSQVNRSWEVFHLILKDGSNMRWNNGEDAPRVISEWTNLLGERAIIVSDYTKIPQIIVSILETMAGKTIDEITESWDGSTAVVVREALSGLTTKNKSDNSGLIEF